MKNKTNIFNVNLVQGVDFIGKFYINQHVKGAVCGEYQILSFLTVGGEQCVELFNLQLSQKTIMPLECIEVAS